MTISRCSRLLAILVKPIRETGRDKARLGRMRFVHNVVAIYEMTQDSVEVFSSSACACANRCSNDEIRMFLYR